MKKYIIFSVALLLALALISCAKADKVVDVEGARMTAKINAISDRIEVEVIEGDYEVSGIYWVRFSQDTVVIDKNGHKASISSLKVGDTVEITYSGQVMQSFPPQIVAKAIRIK